MKEFIKGIIVKVLAWEAHILLWRQKPEVIAITGSGGKTSAKEFLKKLLEIDFEVLAAEEGYNTELGAPLALFQEKTPSNLNSFFAWSKILIKNLFKAIFTRDFPSKIIVEMGADKPGDISHLARIFKPQTGIILSVLPTHLTEFKTEEAVAAEKSELAKAINPAGKLFLNSDDPSVKAMSRVAKSKVYFFGTKKDSDFRAENLKTGLAGTEFDLAFKGEKMKVIARIYGLHMVYPVLAAIAAAIEEGISIRKIKEELKEIEPTRGRMNLIEGINETIIIDDSYNANPTSMSAALDFLAGLKGRKIAILGSMNELGDLEQESHEKIGQKAAAILDLLVTVGDVAGKYMIPAAQSAGLKISQARSFKTAKEAGQFVKNQIQPGDIILVKGSQNGVRTERAIEVIMKEPLDRKKVLVRQSEFWQNQT